MNAWKISFYLIIFTVVDILWQSTTVFLAAFAPLPTEEFDQPFLLVINVPVSTYHNNVTWVDKNPMPLFTLQVVT